MRKHKRKLLVAICSLVLLATLVISVPALIRGDAVKAEGSFERKLVDRIDFLVTNTKFTFEKTENEQLFTFTIEVSAKKTESDFYAVINSISVSGLAYESCVISPSARSAKQLALPNAVLPVVDGKPAEAVWDIVITFKADKALTANPKIAINYTSGVKDTVASEHLLEITASLSVTEK